MLTRERDIYERKLFAALYSLCLVLLYWRRNTDRRLITKIRTITAWSQLIRACRSAAEFKIHNLDNGREAVVTIVDRGPFARGRIIDVSTRAAGILGFIRTGVGACDAGDNVRRALKKRPQEQPSPQGSAASAAGPSIAPFQQPSRDYLRLDFRRALEDVEDARVAEDARDRIFQREAVAAVDLQRVVRGRPGDARAQQLGHAGFEVAAPARVLRRGRRNR